MAKRLLTALLASAAAASESGDAGSLLQVFKRAEQSPQAPQCPLGSQQRGEANAEIKGCGLEGCDARYKYGSAEACVQACAEHSECVAFNWAPLDGDRNHKGQTVCTLYDSTRPTRKWGPNVVFCVLDADPAQCPAGWHQRGEPNAEILGCGLTGCDGRYAYGSSEACAAACDEHQRCLGFSWSPLKGDKNHLDRTVCTLYDRAEPSDTFWGPNTVFCVNDATAQPARDYDEERAKFYAHLSGALYCTPESLASWSCGYKCDHTREQLQSRRICTSQATKMVVAKTEDACIVGFEGTNKQQLQSAIRDLALLKRQSDFSLCKNCKVHFGFQQDFDEHKDCMYDSLQELGCSGREVGVTGHSLGGAVATIAAMHLEHQGWRVREVYTFGSPRVGSRNFARTWTKMFQGRSYRVTRVKDIVANVPPDHLVFNWHFEHVEPEVYYPSDVASGYEVCSIPGKDRCAEEHDNVFRMLLDIVDRVDQHVHYMDIETADFGCEG